MTLSQGGDWLYRAVSRPMLRRWWCQMERLSALDAEFLHLEDGAVHMHIAGACVFDESTAAV